MRFAISYSTPMRLLSIMLGMGPRRSAVMSTTTPSTSAWVGRST